MRVWLRHNRIGFCIAVAALLAACSTASNRRLRTRQRRTGCTDDDRVGRRSEPRRRCRSVRTWHRRHSTSHARRWSRRVDVVGVGPHAQAEAGGVDARRRSAGIRPQHRRSRRACARPTTAPRSRYCSRVSTSRMGWPSPETRCTSRKATRSTSTTTPTAGRSIGAPSPAACPTRKARTCKVRTHTRSRASPSDRTAPSTSRSGPRATSPPRIATPTHRARPSCGFLPAAGPRRRSRPASATAPVWRSLPTVRCGPRSTTATTSPTRQTGQPDPEYVDDHPPESVARLTPGTRIGLALLQSRWRPGEPAVDSRRADQRRRQRMDCESLPPIEQSLGAHAAPLGMSFTEGVLPAPYASGALIGVHGSWNREPPREPEVSFFRLARRRTGRSADARRRISVRGRLALGSPGGRGDGTRRRGLHHRRLRRRRVPPGPAPR